LGRRRPRSGRGETIYDPWHYVPVLARKPGALRNGAPFKHWVLPATMDRVRRRLADADDGNRQMIDILTAVLTDGLLAVEAALDALGYLSLCPIRLPAPIPSRQPPLRAHLDYRHQLRGMAERLRRSPNDDCVARSPHRPLRRHQDRQR
jgi:hypothetical protein